MRVIRKDQVAALNRGRLDRFASELAASLARRFPERFPRPDGPPVTEFVSRAVAAAFEHGINVEVPVATFAHLRAAYGESFEWTPVRAQALAVLRDAALPALIKIAALEDCLHGATGGRPITVVPDGEA